MHQVNLQYKVEILAKTQTVKATALVIKIFIQIMDRNTKDKRHNCKIEDKINIVNNIIQIVK